MRRPYMPEIIARIDDNRQFFRRQNLRQSIGQLRAADTANQYNDIFIAIITLVSRGLARFLAHFRRITQC